MRSMTSLVPWAIPSKRYGSYSTGRTRRRRDTPMFFIARIVAAMLIGFCGSKSTTTMDVSRDSLIDEFDWNQAVLILSVAAQVDELSVAAAQY